MKKIGILGGTFDPIHIGHIGLAHAALSEYNLCCVRVLTGGNPPHKRDRYVTEALHRHEMVKLALKGEKNIVADDFEVNKTDYSYTAKTLTELKALNPDWEIYFIIGEDSLRDLPKWYDPQTVVDNAILLVYPRDTASEQDKLIKVRKAGYNADIRPIRADIVNVSSTEIRHKIHAGEDVSELVCPSVLEYIKKEGLYL